MSTFKLYKLTFIMDHRPPFGIQRLIWYRQPGRKWTREKRLLLTREKDR